MKAYIEKNNLTPKTPVSEPGPTIVSVTSAPPAAAAQSAPAPRPQHPDQELDYEDIEITNMRKVIAKRLLFSKVIKREL